MIMIPHFSFNAIVDLYLFLAINYRMTGYAILAAASLSLKQLALQLQLTSSEFAMMDAKKFESETVFCYIGIENKASQSVFTKLAFEPLLDINWVLWHPNKPST
jgi:hypothetical protein